ncbi:GNAT family N-acetyltransferase [Virgibacillus salinus]|uniref:Acetyltransferase (GNAT) domain-containing protein n=1 Tax=Virgibacillus salinus TaxID=553311 RepID=A0A1H1FWC5_9BACI|nr:GNAT family N-acetyltransferase [Virgibacillus salinus]SDR04978.1 Acetyltransferase (GNAT) domain-containing protein [Virgibacillus salinus]
MRDAATWLIKKGIYQWEYYLSDESVREIKQDINAGTTFLFEDSGGHEVAVFNLSPNQIELDISIWDERSDKAYYLHRLAVNENYHSRQIGKKILAWIMDNIDQHQGILRLDCVAENPKLNQFYLDAGFSFASHAEAMGITFSKYEKSFNGKA